MRAYRPDIDGLRAIAVVAVVLFHAQTSWSPGGFVGVDVFFVISGFLISRIILSELADGTFTIWGFYKKRIRRIFPALIVVLLATLAMGWWSMLSDEFRQLGKHVVAGGGFVSNIVLWREANYFDVSGKLKPLLHLWSLGIEEQFYLIWPALLLLASRRRLSPLLLVGAILLASFVINLVMVGRSPVATFYLPVTRFWELMTGCGLAVYSPVDEQGDGLRAAPAWRNDALSLTGAVLLLLALVLADATVPFPGWWALLPVTGTALMILAGPTAWLNRVVLSQRWVVGIGLISYPLYLWHWPLLSMLHLAKADATLLPRLAAVASALILALLTYQIVEKPLRRNRSPILPVALLAGMLLVMGIGALAFTRQLPARAFPRDRYIEEARADWAYPEPDTTILGFPARTIGSSPDRVLWIGDSNIEQYYPRIQRITRGQPHARASVFVTGGGCPALPGVTEKKHDCPQVMSRLADLATATGARRIVLASAWLSYFASGSTYVVEDGAARRPLSSPRGREAALDGFATILHELRRRGLEVYVVLNIPAGEPFDPSSMVSRSVLHGVTFGHTDADRSLLELYNAAVEDPMRAMARTDSVTVIDPFDHLCTPTTCPVTQDGARPRYKDAAHLRASYMRDEVTFLDAIVLAP